MSAYEIPPTPVKAFFVHNVKPRSFSRMYALCNGSIFYVASSILIYYTTEVLQGIGSWSQLVISHIVPPVRVARCRQHSRCQ